MTAHHFFVEPDAIAGGVVRLERDEAHHAARVLRVQPGETITVADGTGRVIRAVVIALGDVVEADVKDEWHVELPRPAITLFQALPKGDKLDDVVEKATEVGVQRVAPFAAERTIVKWDERKLERSHQRWTAIARAAAKQSGAPRIPAVEVVAPDATDALCGSGPKIVLHEQADDLLRSVLPDDAPDELTLVIGPEGGLTDEEVEELRSGGAKVATLGPRVLRTETAGPVAAAVVGYHYGSLG